MGIGTKESTFVFGDTKYGRKLSSVTSFNIVSEMGVVLPFYPGSAQIISVAAVAATDTASGTGMRKIHLEGVGSGFILQHEDVWLDATSPVATALEWLRIDRMFGLRAGSNDTNAGGIWAGLGTFTGGVPADKISHINTGDGQTQEMKWTVPVSHEMHVHLVDFTSGKAQGADVVSTFRIRSRLREEFDGPWLVRYEASAFDGPVGYNTALDAIIIAGPADVIAETVGTGVGALQTGIVGYELHKKLQGNSR